MIYAGKMIAPVIAGIVIAYILEGGVKNFEAIKVPRLGAVLIVLGLFLILCFALVFGILPLVSTQALQMASQIPSWIADMQARIVEIAGTLSGNIVRRAGSRVHCRIGPVCCGNRPADCDHLVSVFGTGHHHAGDLSDSGADSGFLLSQGQGKTDRLVESIFFPTRTTG